jgi:hypothetical protein
VAAMPVEDPLGTGWPAGRFRREQGRKVC